ISRFPSSPPLERGESLPRTSTHTAPRSVPRVSTCVRRANEPTERNTLIRPKVVLGDQTNPQAVSPSTDRAQPGGLGRSRAEGFVASGRTNPRGGSPRGVKDFRVRRARTPWTQGSGWAILRQNG